MLSRLILRELVALFSTYSLAIPRSGVGGSNQPISPASYRAAVFEHAVVTPIKMATSHEEAVSQMMVNLKEYEKQATLAGLQDVDILVFPEDGIYGFIRDHVHMQHYVEHIPDPEIHSWTPCDEPDRFLQNLDVVIFLSCIAKNNSLYLVANYGDAVSCLRADPNCPSNGQYQYNTDLAFDPRGQLIAKYHKQNLYYESQFDEPITPEYVYFDTEFGRFGMITCFDILFHEPLIPLLTVYNITDIVFPTAWRDVMPFYSAIGYHSSVAAAYKVNLLSANIHLPLLRFQGSGIYTPDGFNTYHYDRITPFGKLLISDVRIIRPNNFVSEVEIQLDGLMSGMRLKSLRYLMAHDNVLKANTSVGSRSEISLMAVIFKDWYHIVPLNKSSASLKICQRGICCFLEYTTDGLKGMYAFGVFNGRHTEQGVYYLQVCILLACPSNDVNSCGQSTFNAETKFKSVRMSGTFETPYVTPQIVLAKQDQQLYLPRKGSMVYRDGELTGSDDTMPLLEACLFGRYYDRD